jgi:hypothetical protein
VDQARRLLGECLSELDLTVEVLEKEGDYPSPTIRVNGRDVMGQPDCEGACCRLDVPTRDRVLDALKLRS